MDEEQPKQLEEVNFLPAQNGANGVLHKPQQYLTREELLAFESAPFWKRLRWILFICFWAVWLLLLLGAILIIVRTPSCPPVPDLPFWQKKTGYFVTVGAYADSDNNLIGDIKGLLKKIEYIRDSVGAGFVIISPIFSGVYTNSDRRIGYVDDFKKVDAAFGTEADVSTAAKVFHKHGMELIMEFDFSAISPRHQWATNIDFLAKYSAGDLNRDTGSAQSTANSTIYSVLDKGMFGLNLTNEQLEIEVGDVIKYWLKMGVDGVMLKNVAYYTKLPGGAGENWLAAKPSSQIFNLQTVKFLRTMRAIVDEEAKSSGKPKLLAVDPGNTGYGIGAGLDPSNVFIGTKEEPAAHIYVGMSFVKSRGWTSAQRTAGWDVTSIANYMNSYAGDNPFSVALTTATSDTPRVRDILSLASTLLLPGTTLLHYGAELGTIVNADPVPAAPTDIFPKGFNQFLDTDVLTSRLPMPWDYELKGFSDACEGNTACKNFIKDFQIHETVETNMGIGRKSSVLKMVKDLIDLRKNHSSLMWGNVMQVDIKEVYGSELEMFTRKADGYPLVTVILTKEATRGFSFNFEDLGICGDLKSSYSFPEDPDLNPELTGNLVYIKKQTTPAVFVFVCSSA